MSKYNAREKGKVTRAALIIALTLLLHLCLAALAGAVIDSKREKPEFRQEITLRLTQPPPPEPEPEPLGARVTPPAQPLTPPKPEPVKPKPVVAQTPTPEPTPEPEVAPAPEPDSVGASAPSPAPTAEPEPSSEPAPTTAVTNSADTSAIRNYGSIVRSRIDRSKRYPTEARQAGLEGRVRLRLTIAADGSLTSVSVSKSSGSEILDNAAILAAQRAAPFSPLPEELGGSVIIFVSLNFNLPR